MVVVAPLLYMPMRGWVRGEVDVERGKEDEEERACGLRQRAGVPETGWVVGVGVQEWEDKEEGGECCG